MCKTHESNRIKNKSPIFRREIEVDYIGLILLASAGYDPRAAPKLYNKFQRITGNSTIFSTHPSGNKRAELVAQNQVMAVYITRRMQELEVEDLMHKYCRISQPQEIPLYLLLYLFCFWLLSMFLNFTFSSVL
jgi:hypothetical protein